MTNTSQNPEHKRRGRPPGSRNIATMLREIANEKVTIRDAAGPRQMTVLQAIILRLQHKAVRGDLRADKRLDAIRTRLNPAKGVRAALLVTPGMLNESEWIRRMEIKNRYAQPPNVDDSPITPPGSPIVPGPPTPSSPRRPSPSPSPPNPWRGKLIR